MARAVLIACSVWWLFTFVIQWLSAWKGRSPCRPVEPPRHAAADFSIVAPMVGAGDATPAYVDALSLLARAGAEVLICVEREEDEAVAAVRHLWPEATILYGIEQRFTAKVNNVEKGFRAATRPVVALCDAGALLTVDQLVRSAAPLSESVGMVLALKAAEDPGTFAAELERAYINGHGARFLFAADWLGQAVASGGVTVLSRETLQRVGYGEGFTRYIADDFSITESVRSLGLGTQLSDVMPRLPLGARTWSEVWGRQVRWARTRLRLPVWPLVMWEPVIGMVFSLAAGVGALALMKLEPEIIVLAAIGHIFIWLAAEKWFMAGRGLAYGMRAAIATLAREILAPVLMATALSGRSMKWREGDLGESWRSRDSSRPGPVVRQSTGSVEVTTIALPDRVDSVSASLIEGNVAGHLRPGARIVIDGSAVVYMSAAGVRALATVLHRAADRQGHVVFCRFSAAAADCLLVSGFSELLEVAGTMEEAIAWLDQAVQGGGHERLHQPVSAG